MVLSRITEIDYESLFQMDKLADKFNGYLENVFNFYDTQTSVNKLVKEMELQEIEYKEILNQAYLLQYRFQEAHITKEAIDRNLDIVVDIKNRLNLAGINNGGYKKELDIIESYLINKINWFMDQEKLTKEVK